MQFTVNNSALLIEHNIKNVQKIQIDSDMKIPW